MFSSQTSRRAGFTLLELLVVLVILVLLAGLIIPRIAGVWGQATAATNANVLAAVNNAVQLFEARYGKNPTTFDYVLDETEAAYKLHPDAAPLVAPLTLTAQQAKSLKDSGMSGGHYHLSTFVGMPHESIGGWAPYAAGKKVLALVKPATFGGHYVDFPDRAFGINAFNAKAFASEYVVLGLAGPTSLKGNTVMEAPIVQSVDPEKYYARVLCVYRVPASDGSQADFTAQFIGCFSPDGKSLNDNVKKYETSAVPLHE